MMLSFQNKQFDLSMPLDISIALHKGFGQVNAFYAPPFRAQPVKEGDFVGATKLGGPVNFMNVQMNPHGNGTHTECVGHIALEDHHVNECLTSFYHLAEVISVYPALEENGDKIIDRKHIEAMFDPKEHIKALIIRTLPNDSDKTSRNYSGNNPPFLSNEAMKYIVACGIDHLLLDLPSVDREQDEGKLACHKIFWNYPENPRLHCTITELIFVPNHIQDGEYLLHIQIPNMTLDAVPSRPVLYRAI